MFNRQEASRLLQEHTVTQYMEKVLQRRDDEDLRSRKFLHPSSYVKVRTECEKRMVADHLAAIHNECPAMGQNEMQQDLRNAFALLKVSHSLSKYKLILVLTKFNFIVDPGWSHCAGFANDGTHQAAGITGRFQFIGRQYPLPVR